MWKILIPLVLGGSLGAISRWGVQRWVDARLFTAAPFPLGTLLVNLVGCFLFGWLFAYLEERAWASETLRLAIFTGFLGSFTTFSTFSWHTLELLRNDQAGLALLNIAASVMLGLGAVWAGLSLAR